MYPQTVSIPFSEKMAKDDKKIIEYHDEDVLVRITDALIIVLFSFICFQLVNEVAIVWVLYLLFCEQDSVLDAVLKQAYKMFKVPNLLLLLVGGFIF